ncbi:diguanylate cyclase [Burkholderia sp. L27(2015)]|uniref:diguanylate cyclase domain-containing protein n=1 Tax=Burkholderia sp. L27(2015) TaxID=1641858 RepID=UPI00131BFD19|nr:diguanylate cyclase [Burkholderia sp. L27(2015)]
MSQKLVPGVAIFSGLGRTVKSPEDNAIPSSPWRRCPASAAVDITERKHYEALLEYHANYDVLTGLANRQRLLQAISQRLKSCVREGDTVARLGGDEFVLVIDHSNDKSAVASRGNRDCATH